MESHIILALTIAIMVVMLIIFYNRHQESLTTQTTQTTTLTAQFPSLGFETENQDPASFYNLTSDQKVKYIVDNYFKGPEDNVQTSAQTIADNKYIDSLPQNSTSCSDDFDDCAKWAANNECVVNPEFMLYACPSSCSACSMTPQQKFNAVQIYNRRPIQNCIYRGQSYPDRLKYVSQLERVFNDPGIPI